METRRFGATAALRTSPGASLLGMTRSILFRRLFGEVKQMIRKLAVVLALCVLCAVSACAHAEDHSIALAGAGNARELGGYTTEDGRTVKRGVLLRTAKLSDATEEDIRKLTDVYHLSVVIDFRGDSEIEHFPDPEIGGVKNLNIQIIEEARALPEEMVAEMAVLGARNGRVTKIDRLRLAIKYGVLEEQTDQMYVEFLSNDRGRAGYAQFFRELLDLPAGEAMLFHCSEGKDRTGCAAMLVLFALGADEATVMEDFLLTNEFNAALIEEDRRMLREEGIPEEEWDGYLPQMDQVSPAYMQNALAWMTENYGSPLGYITQELGVTEEALNELRDKFLE